MSIFALQINPSAMYFIKRKVEQPGIELRKKDGQLIPMHMTFQDGEIHINADEMEKGAYELVIYRGQSKESKAFVVA